jgi:hypothetical protein
MEVMPFITLQLGQLVLWLIVAQANFAAALVFESFWVVLYTSQFADHLRDLAFVKTIWASCLFLHHSSEPHIEDGTTNYSDGENKNYKQADE